MRFTVDKDAPAKTSRESLRKLGRADRWRDYAGDDEAHNARKGRDNVE
jgi:hypothetical protein